MTSHFTSITAASRFGLAFIISLIGVFLCGLLAIFAEGLGVVDHLAVDDQKVLNIVIPLFMGLSWLCLYLKDQDNQLMGLKASECNNKSAADYWNGRTREAFIETYLWSRARVGAAIVFTYMFWWPLAVIMAEALQIQRDSRQLPLLGTILFGLLFDWAVLLWVDYRRLRRAEVDEAAAISHTTRSTLESLNSVESAKASLDRINDKGNFDAVDYVKSANTASNGLVQMRSVQDSAAQALDVTALDIEDLGRAIEFSPFDCNLFFMRAMAKSSTRDIDGAIKDIEDAVRLSRVASDLNRLYAQYALEQGWPNGHTELYLSHLSMLILKKELGDKKII